MSEQQIIMAAMEMGGYAAAVVSPATEDEFLAAVERIRSITGLTGNPTTSDNFAWLRFEHGRHSVSVFAPQGSASERSIRDMLAARQEVAA